MLYQEFSIDEKRCMAHLLLNMRSALLCAHGTPLGKDMWERHTNPIAGDFVVEMSTLYRLVHNPQAGDKDKWDGQFVKFLRTDREWIRWTDGPGGYWETYWVCRKPDGFLFRWHNAEVVVAPIDQKLGGL